MPFEDELGDAMRRTGDTFGPTDRPALVEGGLRRGRRRLARRRAAAVTGSVLALAAVGIGGAYGGGVLGGGGGGGSVAAPDKPAPPVGSKEHLISTLKSLLPKGEITQEGGRGIGGDRPSMPYASVVHDDGKGAAAISVSLERVAPYSGETGEQVTCPDKSVVPYDACTSERLPGSATLMIYQGYEYPDRRVDTKRWHAVLVTREGYQVSLSEWNAPAEKDAEITRTDPPLDPAALKAVVTSTKWQAALKTLPAPPVETVEPGGSDYAEPDGAKVQATLRSLLPKGLKVTAEGGQGEWAYAVVDDGKGATRIEINVQPRASKAVKGQKSIEDELFAGVEPGPDGIKVKTQQRAGEKGGSGVVWWTADTIRPGGLRVVVSAFNSGAQHAAATRSEPALTMEQLKAIATSQKWTAFQ